MNISEENMNINTREHTSGIASRREPSSQPPTAGRREPSRGRRAYVHPVIDIHSHILPKMDDGSSSSAMSIEMLTRAARQGVTHMVATPHFYPQQNSPTHFLSRRAKCRTRLEAAIDEAYSARSLPADVTLPKLFFGAEVAFFPGISNIEDLDRLCILGTDVMLLEMPFCAWSSRTLDEVENISRRGISIIIAHLERFYRYQTDKHIIPALTDMPVTIQANAEGLLSWTKRRRILKMFDDGTAQLLGSDCHNLDSRRPNLGDGRAVLKQKLGPEILEDIDRTAAALLKIKY